MPQLSYATLERHVGEDLGASPWRTIDQDSIDAFASCTDDPQWIHVDRARAQAGPFGTTIAHGYLTLALLVPMLRDLGVFPDDGTTVINYGVDRLRFLQPVPSGARVRARVRLDEVRAKGEGRQLVTVHCEVEIEGDSKPALVADALYLYLAPA